MGLQMAHCALAHVWMCLSRSLEGEQRGSGPGPMLLLLRLGCALLAGGAARSNILADGLEFMGICIKGAPARREEHGSEGDY